jgi:hypothetical protein
MRAQPASWYFAATRITLSGLADFAACGAWEAAASPTPGQQA